MNSPVHELIRELIARERIQQGAIDLLDAAESTGFYQHPASLSGKYHRPDECVPGGLVLHTCRVMKMALHAAERHALSPEERDYVVGAAAIHDLVKFGERWGVGEAARRAAFKNHGPGLITWGHLAIWPAVTPEQATLLEVAARHNGRWSPEGYEPLTPMEIALHEADFYASRGDVLVELPAPTKAGWAERVAGWVCRLLPHAGK